MSHSALWVILPFDFRFNDPITDKSQVFLKINTVYAFELNVHFVILAIVSLNNT
jgi:hypothetical protein